MKKQIFLLFFLVFNIAAFAQTTCNDEKYYGKVHCVEIYSQYCPETSSKLATVKYRFVNTANTWRNVYFVTTWTVGSDKYSESNSQMIDANSSNWNLSQLDTKYSKMKNSASIEITKVENTDISLSLMDSCSYTKASIDGQAEQNLLKKTDSKTENGWTDWYEWNTFDCYKNLLYHIKYLAVGGGIYKFKVEFKNNYSEDLYFSYVLEPSWIAHSIKNADAVEPLKANSLKECSKTWMVTEPGRFQVENMTVSIYNLIKGYSNWYAVTPIYYSECTTVTTTKEVSTNNQNTVKQNQVNTGTVTSEDLDNANETKTSNTIIQVMDTLNKALIKINAEQKAKNDNFLEEINQKSQQNSKGSTYCDKCCEEAFKLCSEKNTRNQNAAILLQKCPNCNCDKGE